MIARSFSGGRSPVSPGPDRSQLPGELALSFRPRKDMDAGVRESVPDRLEDDVGRGAEPGQPEVVSVGDAGEPEGPVADRARAEKRGGLDIAENVRDRIGEILADLHILRVAAVRVAPGAPEIRA